MQGKHTARGETSHHVGPRSGCHYPAATNYDSTALSDDGSCVFAPGLQHGAGTRARTGTATVTDAAGYGAQDAGAAALSLDSSSIKHAALSAAQPGRCDGACDMAPDAWRAKCGWLSCASCAACSGDFSDPALPDSRMILYLLAAFMLASASWLLCMPCASPTLRQRERASGAKPIPPDSPFCASLHADVLPPRLTMRRLLDSVPVVLEEEDGGVAVHTSVVSGKADEDDFTGSSVSACSNTAGTRYSRYPSGGHANFPSAVRIAVSAPIATTTLPVVAMQTNRPRRR